MKQVNDIIYLNVPYYCNSMVFFLGFGYALLANVPPVYGLYTSFWCVLLYFLFGQSQHVSFGTMAITSIMVAEAANANADQMATSSNQTTGQLHADLQNSVPISLANEITGNITAGGAGNNMANLEGGMDVSVDRTLLITMMTGMILIVMSVLKMSKVVVFLPISCISGFTTAAAFHIITSQVKFILGINIVTHKGIFKFVKLWKEIILRIPNTNICDLIISICCFIFLVSVKEIINPKLKHKLPVPVPAEIIVVTVVTLVSYLVALSDNFGIKIVDEVPAGFILPTIPNFHGFESYMIDAFLIAVISFVISYSMVSTFARKHQYEVDAGQEMIAYGMCHLIGSIFGGFTATAAPPRCTVLDTTGAKTQIVHVFTSIVLLLTILFIGPLFEPLPNSCLSTIIVCALIPLFKQFKHLIQFWQINRFDFAIWLVTWASVLFLDIDIGLAIGVGFSITTISVQACLSKGQTLSLTGHEDLHQPSGIQELSEEIPGIKIFRFNSNLHFVTQNQFKEELFKLTVNPTKLPLIHSDETMKSNQSEQKSEITNLTKKDMTDTYITDDTNSKPRLSDVYAVIIDFSSISYIDVMGLNLVKQLNADYGHVGISLVLANCSGAILCKMKSAGIGGKSGNGTKVDQCKIDIFPTIQDAIVSVRDKHRLLNNNAIEGDGS